MSEAAGSPLDILYEDDDLLVLNKPPGISVHPSRTEPKGTLVDAILKHTPDIAGVGEDLQRPGIVHRLDKDTSGVLVVARNQRTFLELKTLFQSRNVEKRYLAIVSGRVKPLRGVIDFPIGRRGIKRVAVKGDTKNVSTRDARTKFFVRRRFVDATLLELFPKTGRMHQIRVHLKAFGHPILGDKLYGGKRFALRAPRQMLHALALRFSLSDGRSFFFEADPPDDFQEELRELTEQSREANESMIQS